MVADTTHREQTTRIFVELFNRAHPDWEVDGDTATDLAPEHVHFLFSAQSIGFVGTDGDDNIQMFLDQETWSNRDTEENVGFITWLLGYFADTPSHTAENWSNIVQIFKTLQSEADTICELFDVEQIDWHEVKAMLIGLLEERGGNEKPPGHWETNGFERRLDLAKKLDYPVGEIDRFSGMGAHMHANDNISIVEDVDLSDVEYKSHSFEEVREWIKKPYLRPAISVSSRTRICYPIAVDRGDFYEIIDGDYRVDFQRYCEEMVVVSIQVVDEALIANQSESMYPLLRYISPEKWAGHTRAELLGRFRTGKEKTIAECGTPQDST